MSVRNLSFTFDGELERALDNISLDIFAGEFVFLAGPSGCGKSTLAKAMAGYIPHVIEGETAGGVWIDGVDSRELDLSDIAVRVSMCQQDPEAQFCTLTVEDEVAFGPENLALPAAEVKRRAAAALADLKCTHLRGRDIFALSGGEQQRVAIASMLAMEPEVLILDEPTSSLDPDAAEEVWAAIEELRTRRGTTIVVIEHRFDRLLAHASRMIVMERGAVVMDGEPETVHRRYMEMLHPSWPELAAPLADGEARCSIRVKDLKFVVGEKAILRGVSFEARPGELIGVVGANGSGKTTFLSCLVGIARATSGEVEMEGLNAVLTRVSEIARKTGFVFQSPNHQLFESTVGDEVAFAARNFGLDRQARAREVMREYELLGYEGRHPLKLSHGEKRRVNLCSILPHDPEVILLDEPFIGQDAINSARILSDILRMKQAGKTVVMVAHDMEIVFRYCDRVVLFEGGRIVVDAPPAEAAKAIAEMGREAYLPGGGAS